MKECPEVRNQRQIDLAVVPMSFILLSSNARARARTMLRGADVNSLTMSGCYVCTCAGVRACMRVCARVCVYALWYSSHARHEYTLCPLAVADDKFVVLRVSRPSSRNRR